MKLMPIMNVKQGDCLAKNVLDADGRILLKEGVILTRFYLSRIEELEIPSIYIKANFNTVVINNLINAQSQQENIKEFFNNIERGSLDSKNINSKAKKLLNETSSSFKSIESTTTNIINEIKNRVSVINCLTAIRKIDNYTYQHSINVAQYSLQLGVQLRLNKNELYTLCVGALLHDIGKVFIPQNIIQKASSLTKEEFEIIKEHTIKGSDYLKGCLNISNAAKLIVLQHHERVDGRGYPNNIKGELISKLSKIVAIADVYDALTSDRPYRKAMCPNNAVEYILSNVNIQFDYEMVKAFSKAIVPYPMGTLVELSNGDVAVVTGLFHNLALRPQVRIIRKGIKPSSRRIDETVSLMKDLDIVIQKIRYLA